MKVHCILLLLPVLALSACTTAQMQAWSQKPEVRAALDEAKRAAFVAAENSAKQALATGKVDTKELVNASLSSIGLQVRGLQGTGKEAQPAAVESAVRDGSAVRSVAKAVAPAVVAAIADAVKKGAPANLANEAAARGLDQAVAGVK